MNGMFVKGYSTHIDGVDNGSEWDEAASYIFINGESNCGVDFGSMKLILDNENKALFFCFMLTDPDLESDNLQTGISLTIENSEPIIFRAGSSSVTYDTDKFSFEGSISVDENCGATCEIRLGMKSGLPRRIDGCVRFIDSSGLPSNDYKFSVVNEGYTELTATELRPTADNSDPAYNPGLLTSKTTKPKNATTKRTTTTKSSYETDAKKETSRPRTSTTRVGYTTEKFVINTSPPYSLDRTTKKQLTKHEQTLSETVIKTTAKNKTTDAITIYYYEKEIIVSEIYKEEKTHSANNEPKSIETETCTTSATIQESAAVLMQESPDLNLTDGKKFKYIIGAVSATSIVLLAAWASKGNNNKESSSDDN